MNPIIFAIVIVVLLWAAAIYLSVKTDILKDLSTGTTKPYSFSRTQLMWWTLIIASCYILAFAHYENLPALNSTTLALLGIGLGTTTFARVVDNTQVNQAAANGIARHQDESSQGFLTDLLSDETGISVHRFQAFVFNVIFGITFFIDFFNMKYTLPSYDSQQLLLLGISSGAYIAIKMNENGVKNTGVIPQAPAMQNTYMPPVPAQPVQPVQPVAPVSTVPTQPVTPAAPVTPEPTAQPPVTPAAPTAEPPQNS